MEDIEVTSSVEVWGEITKNKKPREEFQELLVSLSYLPSAERLTVVILKARNLFLPQDKETIGKELVRFCRNMTLDIFDPLACYVKI